MSEFAHIPVMREAITTALVSPWSNAEAPLFWDGTLGLGGHAEALLEAHPNARLLGTDLDAVALERARQRLSRFQGRVTLLNAGYHERDAVEGALKGEKLSGALLDLGFSSLQVDDTERGFGFASERPWDMRFDTGRGRPTGERVRGIKPEALADILREYGEERQARRYAQGILKCLAANPEASAKEMADALRSAAHPSQRWGRIHPATRSFQAIRIWANEELENLRRYLEFIPSLLKAGARLAVLTYHSLEDRLVKQALRHLSRPEQHEPPWAEYPPAAHALLNPVTRKAVRPDDAEVEANPRARSAKLRIAERLPMEAVA